MSSQDYSKQIESIISSLNYPYGSNTTLKTYYIEGVGNIMDICAIYQGLKFQVVAAFKELDPEKTPLDKLIPDACRDMFYRLQDEVCNKVLGRKT
jgi:hypothetical protein